MKGERPARVLLPSTALPRADRPSGRKPRQASIDALDAEAAAVFEALRAYRQGLARSHAVPPYVIASDRALRDIATMRPATIGELMEAHGIGPAKAERYGRGLLEVVARARKP
jgi:ATP-dependent DNA helicase RecQ